FLVCADSSQNGFLPGVRLSNEGYASNLLVQPEAELLDDHCGQPAGHARSSTAQPYRREAPIVGASPREESYWCAARSSSRSTRSRDLPACASRPSNFGWYTPPPTLVH